MTGGCRPVRRAGPALLAAAALVCTFFVLLPLGFGIVNTGVFFGAGLAALLWAALWACRSRRASARLRRAVWAVCALVWALCLGLFGRMEAAARLNPLPAGTGACVIVVPGAQVRGDQPSVMLRRRLEAALAVAKQHPGSVFVVSGGTGEGQTFSEAEVMGRWLTAQGVPPDKIYPEDQSVNTEENFSKSAAVIRQNSLAGPVVIATDAFHQARCRLWAARAGLGPVYSVCCRSPWGLAPTYWARELCGMAYTYVFCNN